MAQRVEIEWAGETYVIREDQAFEAAAELEENGVTVARLHDFLVNQKYAQLAKAFAVLIGFAGGHVKPQDIHTAIMDGIKGLSEEDVTAVIVEATEALSAILMDGAPSADDIEVDADPNQTAPSSENASSQPSEAA